MLKFPDGIHKKYSSLPAILLFTAIIYIYGMDTNNIKSKYHVLLIYNYKVKNIRSGLILVLSGSFSNHSFIEWSITISDGQTWFKNLEIQ